MRISHETIYRAIYVLPRGGLRRELRAHLRTGRSLRTRRNTRQGRQIRGQITGMVSIHDRPEEIEDRMIPGHYEGDLIVGPGGTRAAIGTLVERTSGHLTAFHLPTEKTTQATIAGLQQALTRAGWPMKTLTWDRGKEMAAHAQFTIDTNIQVYFADPTHPGNAAATRAPTDCSASTSPRASTSPPSPTRTSKQPSPNSTTAPASATASSPPTKSSLRYSPKTKKIQALRPPPESGPRAGADSR